MEFARATLLAGFLLFSGSSFAENCLNFISSDAEAIGDMALCRIKHNGETRNFACQRFQDNDRKYAVLFDGGIEPDAIYASTLASPDSAQLVWSRAHSPRKVSCSLSRPHIVPRNAKLLGAAVCEDENGKFVPCALYRDEAARDPLVRQHMVYFDILGGGPTDKDVYVMGRNNRALSAELAYQLGKSKLSSGCCSQQAAAYLRYAYESFPASRVYQRAWFSLSAAVRAELTDNIIR
jgi:hypothetical protein